MGNPSPELHLENLKPFSKDDVETARKAGKKGAKASNKVQKKKKEEEKDKREFGELIASALSTSIPDKNIKEQLNKLFPTLPANYKGFFVSKLIEFLKEGKKLKAHEFIKLLEFTRDTVGEKPKETIDLNNNFELDKEDKEMLKEFAKKRFNLKE